MSGILRRVFGARERVAEKELRGDDEEARPIRLVFALGNPGKEYAGNRRNVGFWAVNRLAAKHGLDFSTKTGTYALAQGEIAGRRVALARTRTYNNDSGSAVMALVRTLKLDHAQEMLIVCDHLDLPTGKVRLRRNGSGGGQKGVADIIAKARTDDFPRVRIGIGRPAYRGEETRKPEHVAAWVLGDPTREERKRLDEGVDRAVEAIEVALSEGIEPAMNRYNRDDGGGAEE